MTEGCTRRPRDSTQRLDAAPTGPAQRLAAIRHLSAAGVPVGVMVAPVVPGLTDHEIPELLEAAAEAGARSAGWVLLRLPHGLRSLFEEWLHAHRPLRAERVLARVRDLRGGGLNDARFGTRMRGEGPWAAQLSRLFDVARRRAGLNAAPPTLSVEHFRRPGQLDLFGR